MLTYKYRYNEILAFEMTKTASSLLHMPSDTASFSWFSTAELCSYVFYVKVPNICHGFRCHNYYSGMFLTINAPFVHHFRSQSQFHKHLLHTDRYTCVHFFIFEYYTEQALYSESGEITMFAKISNRKDRRKSDSA